MRAEIFAYMIYLEGLQYPEYVMHIFYLKYSGTPTYRNMLGNSLPVGPAQQTKENYPKYSVCPQKGIYVMQFFCIKYSRECFR